nr:GGDEF domain-containing protein [Lachnospiraceae bacterium]
MKQSRGKKKNDRSIVGILLLGLLVLTVCLAICLVHIADIKKIFEQVKTEESYQKVINAEAVLNDHVGSTLELLSHAAFLMTAGKQELGDEAIFEIVRQYGQMDEFDHVYYVSDKAQLYRIDGTVVQMSREDIAHLLYITKANCFAHYQTEGAQKGSGVAYYVAPVRIGGKKVGQLVGATTMDTMLDSSAFEHLKELGDIFLISADGQIYASDADLYVTDSDDFYEYLRNSCADKYSDNRVLDVKEQMTKEQYQKSYIVDHEGMTDYIEIAAVERMGDIYFAYLYPETVVTDIVNPVVNNSLITCVMIIAVTLWMLFYMWATSKQASDTIELLAYGDPITGGKNDNYFRNVAADVIWENTSVPYLVARFDVANFRYINEAYGHVRADEL